MRRIHRSRTSRLGRCAARRNPLHTRTHPRADRTAPLSPLLRAPVYPRDTGEIPVSGRPVGTAEAPSPSGPDRRTAWHSHTLDPCRSTEAGRPDGTSAEAAAEPPSPAHHLDEQEMIFRAAIRWAMASDPMPVPGPTSPRAEQSTVSANRGVSRCETSLSDIWMMVDCHRTAVPRFRHVSDWNCLGESTPRRPRPHVQRHLSRLLTAQHRRAFHRLSPTEHRQPPLSHRARSRRT